MKRFIGMDPSKQFLYHTTWWGVFTQSGPISAAHVTPSLCVIVVTMKSYRNDLVSSISMAKSYPMSLPMFKANQRRIKRFPATGNSEFAGFLQSGIQVAQPAVLAGDLQAFSSTGLTASPP